MRALKVLAVLLVLGWMSTPVWAYHRHVPVIIAGPWWGPPAYYYPPPGYYYPPDVPSAPPVYIEQQAAPVNAQAPAEQVWYYCVNPKGYYPYVQTCPAGWQKVAPIPPATSGPQSTAP